MQLAERAELSASAPFPETPRAIYEKTPLEEVVCQLKFPAILRIDSEPPAAFQDSLRNQYPLLQELEEARATIELPPFVAKLIGREIPTLGTTKNYQFVSEDQRWRVALTREFLALSTRNYKRWEEFRERMQAATETLIATYRPAFFSRVGLRYRDVIRRSALGLSQADWKQLLRPHILGELASKEVASAVRQALRDVTIDLPRQAQVRIRHGLTRLDGGEELCYVIDADFFFEGKTEVNDAFRVLNDFHRWAGNLFRWCITPDLHERMGPSAI